MHVYYIYILYYHMHTTLPHVYFCRHILQLNETIDWELVCLRYTYIEDRLRCDVIYTLYLVWDVSNKWQ